MILGVRPDIIGEVIVKWFEMIQTGLPMCALASFVGPFRVQCRFLFKSFDFGTLFSLFFSIIAGIYSFNRSTMAFLFPLLKNVHFESKLLNLC